MTIFHKEGFFLSDLNVKTVGWFSGGVSSFVAIYLMRKDIDEVIFLDINDHHDDTYRFLEECEILLDKKITILKHAVYPDVASVIKKYKYINGPYGARCTSTLKKQVRLDWEKQQTDVDVFRYVWGYDIEEKHRAERILQTSPEYEHLFPLIDNHLSKSEVHGVLQQLNLSRPAMYDLGYSNNNCVGCVKGGKGYWNKIRVDFPEKFKQMAELERYIGASCINGVYLDELLPEEGRMAKEIMPDCGMLCDINYLQGNSI